MNVKNAQPTSMLRIFSLRKTFQLSRLPPIHPYEHILLAAKNNNLPAN
jgi:hypothetical protein